MTDLPATRLSLVLRLRDGKDREAWRQFVQIYAPVVYRYARKRGLQDADAADLTQDVLRAVNGSVGRFEGNSSRGSFRGWLFTLAHHKLYDLLARQRRECAGSGDSGVLEMLQRQPAAENEELWNREYQQRVFAWAVEQVRPAFQERTWQAFWQAAVEGRSGQHVAEELGMTVAAVYLAKSRVMARIREQIQQIQGDETFLVDDSSYGNGPLPTSDPLASSAGADTARG
jgi:RNA polymerase sigma-70 factor (ECF subfamily)